MSRRGREAPDRRSRQRVWWLATLILALFLIAGIRVVHLQVFKAQWLRAKADDQRKRKVELLPPRGTIYDRNRKELARSLAGSSVFADPSMLLGSPAEINRLCKALGLAPEAAVQIMRKGGSRFAWLKRPILPEEAEAVLALGIAGVGIAGEPQRYYPKKALAGQVLGFVGLDGNGLEGLEYRYDRLLRGHVRSVPAECDARGRLMLTEAPDPNEGGGNSLVLTIDETIQHIAEEELSVAVEKSRAKGGSALVIDPSTGEILALAQLPAFNPNLGATIPPEDRKLKVAIDVYEPGSTMKALFVGVLLDRKIARPTDMVFCENGQWHVNGHTIHDHVGHGWLSVAEVLKVSSNIGVAKLSEKISPQALYEGLRAFGIGAPTDLGLPGESGGIFPPPRTWSKISAKTIAYGHGVSVTALQALSAYSAIANHGVRMKLRLVKAVLDQEGRELERFEPEPAGVAISKETAVTLAKMMEAVVEEGGTATRAAVPGYTVAGKTGTAWKPDPESSGYDRSKVVSSFVGFVPASSPRVAIVVAVDEPSQGSRYGGMVAGPVFREMARRILAYLRVPPETNEQLQAGAEATGRPARSSAQTAVGTMPDVLGLTMREVLRGLAAAGSGIQPSLMGTGIAAGQDPAPGTPLEAGQGCRVVFRPVL